MVAKLSRNHLLRNRPADNPIAIASGIVVLCGICFFSQLGNSKLWDRDEPRNARCAVEMMQRGDWVVPTFNGELRAHKPALLYWLIMSAYAVFGVSEWSARFWSATLSTGTVLLTYGLGYRIFNPKSAAWAAVVLATALMFNVAARAATPDAPLIFFSTLTLFCFVQTEMFREQRRQRTARIRRPPRGPDSTGAQSTDARPSGAADDTFAIASRRISPKGASPESGCSIQPTLWLLAGYAAMGLAVLAKGPVGIVLPATIWALFLFSRRPESENHPPLDAGDSRSARLRHQLPRWLDRDRTKRAFAKMHPALGLCVLAVVALPWYVAVGTATDGQWLRDFFLRHNLGRAIQPMEGHSGNTLFYYPVAILVGFFPWSVFALPGILWVSHQLRTGICPSYRLLLIWIGVYVSVFSLASTKLPNYVTPAYPALALITGDLLANWCREQVGPSRHWCRWAAGCLMLVGLVCVTALPWVIDQLLPGHEALALVGLIPLIGGSVAWFRFRQASWQAGFRTIAVTGCSWIVALFAWAAPQISQQQRAHQLVASLTGEVRACASLGIHEPSWIFYAKRTIPFLTTDQLTEARRILNAPNGRLLTSQSIFRQVRDDLPADVRIIASVPYFLKKDQLILIDSATYGGTTSTKHQRASDFR